MSSSLFRLTCQPNDCEMLRNIMGAGPRCICCTGIVVYRCIRQQHNDNWFFPRSNGLSDHALPWRRSAQHCPTVETFCPTPSYLGDVLPNTALPGRRSAPHCPTLDTFCPTLAYLGYVLPNTCLQCWHVSPRRGETERQKYCLPGRQKYLSALVSPLWAKTSQLFTNTALLNAFNSRFGTFFTLHKLSVGHSMGIGCSEGLHQHLRDYQSKHCVHAVEPYLAN